MDLFLIRKIYLGYKNYNWGWDKMAIPSLKITISITMASVIFCNAKTGLYLKYALFNMVKQCFGHQAFSIFQNLTFLQAYVSGFKCHYMGQFGHSPALWNHQAKSIFKWINMTLPRAKAQVSETTSLLAVKIRVG